MAAIANASRRWRGWLKPSGRLHSRSAVESLRPVIGAEGTERREAPARHGLAAARPVVGFGQDLFAIGEIGFRHVVRVSPNNAAAHLEAFLVVGISRQHDRGVAL